jgi:O-methyltransferase
MSVASRTRAAAKGIVRALPRGDEILAGYRRGRRSREERTLLKRSLRDARSFLEAGRLFFDAQDAILSDFEAVCLSTQVSFPAICNLEAVARDVVSRRTAGAFVECGTWRGGAIGYWARSYLRNGGLPERSTIFGFDSFQGMPQMTQEDGDAVARWLHGKALGNLAPAVLQGALTPVGLNVATEDDCRSVLAASGFPASHVSIVKGWFQDTLAAHKSKMGLIAVLRLDGDFYQSTRYCLETLYDQVVPGGAVIIDDYGAFPGCKQAVDEFLVERAIAAHLVYVDESVRFFHKP